MKKNGEFLMGLVQDAVVTGETSYGANRRAVEALDVQENADAGLRALEDILSGIDVLDGRLKEIEDAARSLARNASAVL